MNEDKIASPVPARNAKHRRSPILDLIVSLAACFCEGDIRVFLQVTLFTPAFLKLYKDNINQKN